MHKPLNPLPAAYMQRLEREFAALAAAIRPLSASDDHEKEACNENESM